MRNAASLSEGIHMTSRLFPPSRMAYISKC
jgi:hypothetical protein